MVYTIIQEIAYMKNFKLSPTWHSNIANILLMWMFSLLIYVCAIEPIATVNKELCTVILVAVFILVSCNQIKKIFLN